MKKTHISGYCEHIIILVMLQSSFP